MMSDHWRSAELAMVLLVLQHCLPQTAAGSGLPQPKSQQQVAQQQQQEQQMHPQALHQQHFQQLQLQPQPQQQHVQYVHDKTDEPMKGGVVSSEEDTSDPYQMLHEPRLPASSSSSSSAHPQWNSFAAPPAQMSPAYGGSFDSFPAPLHMPRFLPLLGYPQPVFIPYPLYFAPEMFYPAFPAPASHDFDDNMARAASTGRRTSAPSGYPRNSPIYYVRLPPTPYMFLPGLGGYSSMAPPPPPPPAAAFGSGFASMLNSFQTLPTLPAFSSVFNLPLNFLANGKPSGIYQMAGAHNDYQSALQFAASRPPTPPPPPNPYRPMHGGYLPLFEASGAMQQSSPAASPPTQQESKLTALKRPFLFNGRPEDIYVLPNNFGPLYADSGYY